MPQLVTFASIVEGEARADDERETIAGVYHNRLRIGMALQADPTVQYAIFLATGKRRPRLFTKDYQFRSPYNTYLNPGLPPGPVNSPSRRSIEAALYPGKVPYLYFVAGPEGRHVFSRTYDEHLRVDREGEAGEVDAFAGLTRVIVTAYLTAHACSYLRVPPHIRSPRIPEITATPAPPPASTTGRSSGLTAPDRDAGRSHRPARPAGEIRPAQRRPRVGLGSRRPPGPDAPVVGGPGRFRLRHRSHRGADDESRVAAIRRASATGRSSGPRWTPAAPAARATSGRSLTSTGIRSAAIRARAPSTCSRGVARLSRSCTEVAPPRCGGQGERHEVAALDQTIISDEHQPNHRRYIICHDASRPPAARHPRRHHRRAERRGGDSRRDRRAAPHADRGQRASSRTTS